MRTKFKNKKGQQIHSLSKGFTLIEILLAVAIFTLIVGALTLFSRNIFIYTYYVSTGLTDSNNGRNALKTMVAEIRTASSTSATGAYTIALATPTAFTFYSDIDGDGLVDKVRYFLSGPLLQKGVIKPTGSPLAYVAANEKISTLIPDVSTGTTVIFNYYDSNYDGTTAALATPINIPAIRLVKITVNVEKDPNMAPAITSFSTQTSIRNLKDNL